jgi:copper transport protein
LARRIGYLAVALFVAGFSLLAAPPAAWAHATLESTSPAEGAIVPHAPTRVTATFDEPVGVSPTSLEVFSPTGSRVDEGGTTHGSAPDQIAVSLKPGLGNGTYTVSWHVISADSHPVQGAFTFSIGAPSSTSVNLKTLNQTAGPLVGMAFAVVRFVAYCCFALLAGAVAFVLWCWPAGASNPLVLRLTMGAWSGLAGSVLGAVLLQGVYGAGEGVSKVFWPNVLHATLHSRYGESLGIRLLLVIVALFVFTSILGNLRVGRRVSVRASVTWGVLAAALAATWAAADHAGVGMQVPLSLVSDTIHLSSVALWLGGLTMLATIVLRRSRATGAKVAGRPPGGKARLATEDTVQAVERFSPIALACVGAILLTGTYQAWRGVGTWPALFDTTYGRLLLIKIGAMCVLIALGYVARIRIAALRAPASQVPVSLVEFVAAGLPRVSVGARLGQGIPGIIGRPGHGGGNGSPDGSSSGSPNGASWLPVNGSSNGFAAGSPNGSSNGSSHGSARTAVTLSRLRWSVAAEAVIASAVLAVTAVLVNTPTARESFKPPVSAAVAFDTGGPDGRGNVSVTVTPAVLGTNQVRISVTGSTGRPYSPQQIDAALVLPARHLGPLPVALKQDGAGRYASGAVTVAITGQWQLQITIRSDAFDETTVVVPASIH